MAASKTCHRLLLAEFAPSASCKNLDLPPVNLRFLHFASDTNSTQHQARQVPEVPNEFRMRNSESGIAFRGAAVSFHSGAFLFWDLHGKSGNGLYGMAQKPSPPVRLHRSLEREDAASLRRFLLYKTGRTR
ncbi:MAG: hypothetical protein IKK57_04460 [Clostridia bacterium]|nr:hypothetical protein [Clostridia bacterium]